MEIEVLREKESIIEALLFAAGDKIEFGKICEILDMDEVTVKYILEDMTINYNNSSRGIFLREINGGYQLSTKPRYYDYVKKLFEPRQKQDLSQAAFETLAIIAYNQPITRTKIENMRGVNSDRGIERLLERNLIKEAGRLDAPGRPMLYETTEEFLRSFGFASCAELPVL